MKQFLSLFTLLILSTAANANNNNKVKRAVKQNPTVAQHQTMPTTDTATQHSKSFWELDPRLGRYMYVVPKEQQENPYQFKEKNATITKE